MLGSVTSKLRSRAWVCHHSVTLTLSAGPSVAQTIADMRHPLHVPKGQVVLLPFPAPVILLRQTPACVEPDDSVPVLRLQPLPGSGIGQSAIGYTYRTDPCW